VVPPTAIHQSEDTVAVFNHQYGCWTIIPRAILPAELLNEADARGGHAVLSREFLAAEENEEIANSINECFHVEVGVRARVRVTEVRFRDNRDIKPIPLLPAQLAELYLSPDDVREAAEAGGSSEFISSAQSAAALPTAGAEAGLAKAENDGESSDDGEDGLETHGPEGYDPRVRLASAAMIVRASMAEEGLGPIEWWEQDEDDID
jgi:hypothetical protein